RPEARGGTLVNFFVEIFGFLDVVLRGVANAAQAMTLGGILFMFVVAPPAPSDESTDESGDEGTDQRMRRRLRFVMGWSAGVLAVVEAAEITLKVMLLLGTVDVTVAEAATSAFAIGGAIQCVAAIAIAVLCAPRFNTTPGRRADLLRLALG